MKILVFDNYDSFTYNLVHILKNLIKNTDIVEVFRNDKIALEQIKNYDKILLSPGPSLPKDAGLLLPLIQEFASQKSILGVCLGLQAIAESFGGKLENLKKVYHGIATNIEIIKSNELLFDDIPTNFEAGRYHSWVVSHQNLPECLEITAKDNENYIMALSHKQFDVRGVQFHPESILTPFGKKMIENWLKN